MAKYIDLFAGIGGFRLGLDKYAECVFTSEIDRLARKTYLANHKCDNIVGDIRDVDAATIPDFDLLCGGFPCQAFSIAGLGRRRWAGTPTGFSDKTKGTLFFDIVRILREKQPLAFFLENVPHLLNHDKGRTWAIIQHCLREAGYTVRARVISAELWVPQTRRRVYIVGFKDGTAFNFNTLKYPMPPYMVLNDILEDEKDIDPDLLDHITCTEERLKNQLERHKKILSGKAKINASWAFRLLDRNKPIGTLLSKPIGDYHVWLPQPGKRPRELTVKEMSRCMGFPEDFVWPVSWYRGCCQLGNAVVPQVISAIGEKLMPIIDSKIN